MENFKNSHSSTDWGQLIKISFDLDSYSARTSVYAINVFSSPSNTPILS